jgi:REP element-mobilizing transposase RayT
VYGYAVMSNHTHLVVYVDPAAAKRWPDRDVAERWCRLFPHSGETERSMQLRVELLLLQSDRLASLRARLCSLSWFMRCLNEPIARRANAEDDCTGRFWEGRFKSQALLDERAVLAAMAYVDLNPIRADITDQLDQCDHTSVQKRLLEIRRAPVTAARLLGAVAGSAVDPPTLSITAEAYIEVVEWTGRGLRSGKDVFADGDPPALLDCLQISGASWLLQVQGIGCPYYRVIGSARALMDKAERIGQHWLKGIAFARRLEAI